jgi:hypothetical protein
MTDTQLGYILIAAGLMILAWIGIRSMNNRFERYLQEVREAGESELENISREVSELTLRDKVGKLFSVKIIIDHNLNPQTTPSQFQDMVSSGEAGKISEILEDNSDVNPAIGEVKEFVFSAQAIDGMRSAGLEPDAIVIKMLRASGKIA